MHAHAVILGSPERVWALRVEPFGLFVAIGVGLGVLLAARLAERNGLPPREGLTALVAALAASLIGARVVYLLGASRVSLREALAVGHGGLSGYGALFGAAAAAVIVLRRSRWLAAWLDVGALGALAAIAIGRLGSELAGSDFGRALGEGAPRWLARLGSFPRPSGELTPVWAVHSLRGSVNMGSLTTPALHPIALYEALGVLALLATLLALLSRQRRRGQSFAIALCALAVLRFGLDGLRDDAERGKLGSFSLNRVAAVTSVLSLVAGVALARERRAQRASSN
jgi:phosphatidylglycerol:prolipoprotein diacylglycerol transferase